MLPTSPTSAVGSFKSEHSASNVDLAADAFDFPQVGGRTVKNSIDYSKFKTKLCRHYLNGFQCPFEDRCAFSHGEAPRSRQPPPSFQEYQSSVESSPVKGLPPPPPSYHESVAALGSDSPRDSEEISTPPSYPTRFRYEPYSVVGIIYES